MRIQLISNPASGSYSAAFMAKLETEFARQGASVVRGESSPRTPLVIDPEADRLCVVGGDGTVRHVVAALQASGRALPLVAYPGGTVNLMQLETRLPTAIPAFVARALDSDDMRGHYSVSINDTLFLTCASVGPDSAAVANLSSALKRWIGKLAYVVAFLGVLWHWPRPALRLRVDSESIDCEALYLAKGRYFAGPWSFAPAARLDAATLHLVTLQSLTRWRYLRFMLAMMLGRPVENIPGVETRSCTQLVIESTDALAVQADGDIVSHLPARITLAATPIPVIR